jgi:hypothetical protein
MAVNTYDEQFLCQVCRVRDIDKAVTGLARKHGHVADDRHLPGFAARGNVALDYQICRI